MARTTQEVFQIAMVRAHLDYMANNYAERFRRLRCFRQSKVLAKRHGLPHVHLVIIPLALYIASGRQPNDPRVIRNTFVAAQSHLKRARKLLVELEDSGVVPSNSEIEDALDGSMVITSFPSTVERFVEQIDVFLQDLDAIREKATVPRGRRRSYIRHAVRQLDHIIETNNPRLRPQVRRELCEDLFDEVRAQRPERPAAELEAGLGYRDLLKECGRARRARARVELAKK